MNRRELHCERTPIREGLDFYLIDRHDGQVWVAEPEISMRKISDSEIGGRPCLPAFSLSPNEAVELMDSLMRAGIRPSKDGGSIGVVERMDAHIKSLETQLEVERKLRLMAAEVTLEDASS